VSGGRGPSGPTADAIGAILTGGASRRLGRDKCRVEVGGARLVDRVYEALSAEIREVVLVGKEGDEPPLAGVPFVTDAHPERCALAGVVRALEHAADRPVLVTGCDHPFLARGVVRLLLSRLGGSEAVAPEIDGRLEPLLSVVRPAAALPLFRDRLREGRLGLQEALRRLDLDPVPEAELRRVDPELVSLVNVNDDAGLRRARRLHESRRGGKRI
jgi:molybdopterin-guanine dinucleotide biosynthesis protein A